MATRLRQIGVKIVTVACMQLTNTDIGNTKACDEHCDEET